MGRLCPMAVSLALKSGTPLRHKWFYHKPLGREGSPMFVDHNRHYAWDKLRQRDFRIFAPILTDQIFEHAAYYAGVSLGGGPLGLVVLVWLGINSALHPGKCFSHLLTLS